MLVDGAWLLASRPFFAHNYPALGNRDLCPGDSAVPCVSVSVFVETMVEFDQQVGVEVLVVASGVTENRVAAAHMLEPHHIRPRVDQQGLGPAEAEPAVEVGPEQPCRVVLQALPRCSTEAECPS